MKKLMIAAAIVCAAAMSQAAALDWKWTSTLTDQPNGAAYNGTVYIINALSYSQQNIIDNVLKGTGSLSSYAMESTGISTTNGKAPTAATQITSDSSTFSPVRPDESVAGKNWADYFYAALTTDEDGKKWLFLSATKSTSIQTADATHISQSLSSSKTLFDNTDTFSSQGWYSSVPEPTSGLLLLLGVAGLALRRRRA